MRGSAVPWMPARPLGVVWLKEEPPGAVERARRWMPVRPASTGRAPEEDGEAGGLEVGRADDARDADDARGADDASGADEPEALEARDAAPSGPAVLPGLEAVLASGLGVVIAWIRSTSGAPSGDADRAESDRAELGPAEVDRLPSGSPAGPGGPETSLEGVADGRPSNPGNGAALPLPARVGSVSGREPDSAGPGRSALDGAAADGALVARGSAPAIGPGFAEGPSGLLRAGVAGTAVEGSDGVAAVAALEGSAAIAEAVGVGRPLADRDGDDGIGVGIDVGIDDGPGASAMASGAVSLAR